MWHTHHHHINICLNVSISYIKSNVNHFFEQQIFFIKPTSTIKKISCQVLIATLSKQKISIIKSNDWKKLVTTPKKSDCSQKNIVVQSMMAWSPPLN